jgi:hypothetical protein
LYKKKLNPYVFILIVFVLAFFPIVSFLFAVKNDILTGYLPVKYFISESIASGYFPWWNPFVNFGIPQHADMSSGFWNPVTWVISFTTGYNIYTITIEVLFYILIGGFGMYKIGELWSWDKNVRLIAAISYMCCGYFIGHLQHLNWISGAGFLPWCFLNYILLFKQFSFYRVSLTVFFFYCFISSSHPGLIIGSIYFFGFITIQEVIILVKSSENKTTKKNIWIGLGLFLMLLILVSAAMIISYSEIIPFITREVKPNVLNGSSNSTTINSLFSFLLPFPSVKGQAFFGNDISLRNCYIGLIPFIALICSIKYCFTDKRLKVLLLSSVFIFFISIPSIFQIVFLNYFPLLGYVRLPGEFRIFSLFGFIVIASSWLNHYLNQNIKSPSLNRVLLILQLFFLVVIGWSLMKLLTTNESFIFKSFPNLSSTKSIDYIKSIIDAISLYDAAIIQCIIQILFLTFVRKYLINKQSAALLVICIIDLLVATTLNLPFTGYGKSSPASIQSLLNKAPKGIFNPILQPIKLNDKGINGIDSILGSWSFYNKEPGTIIQANYPIIFKTENIIFNKQNINYLAEKPFIFFIKDTADFKQSKSADSINHTINVSTTNLIIKHFDPNRIKAVLKTDEKGFIVLLYKDYKHWSSFINGMVVPKSLFLESFICVPINLKGTNEIEFTYKPGIILLFANTGLIIFLLLTTFIFFIKIQLLFKQKNNGI